MGNASYPKRYHSKNAPTIPPLVGLMRTPAFGEPVPEALLWAPPEVPVPVGSPPEVVSAAVVSAEVVSAAVVEGNWPAPPVIRIVCSKSVSVSVLVEVVPDSQSLVEQIALVVPSYLQ
jgi:hypothetical protein